MARSAACSTTRASATCPARRIRYVLAQGVTQWCSPGFVDGRDDLGLVPRYIVPLRERGHLLGLMVIVAPQRQLTEREKETIARAAHPMSAEMYAEHLAADTEETGARDLLLGLLGTDPAVRDAARRQALGSGLLKETPHVVVSVVQVSRGEEPPGRTEVALRGAVEGFRQTCSAHGVMAVEQDRAVLLQVRDRPPGPDEVREQSRRVIEELGTFLDASAAPVVGIGGPRTGLADAWTSYEQALVAVRAARRLPHLKGPGDWADLGEFAVLLQLPEYALNASLLPQPLRALAEAHGGARLRDTLRCFLDDAGSIPRTADALRLHRTSLYYRLRQIREIPASTWTTAPTGWSCTWAFGSGNSSPGRAKRHESDPGPPNAGNSAASTAFLQSEKSSQPDSHGARWRPKPPVADDVVHRRRQGGRPWGT
ncbi:PucR family transcriptional regulator [Streptomyces coeruleorubidus]|uniref:PucR family transcriptional regulator n=1 Tax=Streptomyces coeruleorubidus TaxID=116188 RepID=UPI00368CE419